MSLDKMERCSRKSHVLTSNYCCISFLIQHVYDALPNPPDQSVWGRSETPSSHRLWKELLRTPSEQLPRRP